MDQDDFEGTLVLEKLVAIERVEEFFDAVDSDDESKAVELMEAAGVDAETIAQVLKRMRDPGPPH